MATPFEGIEAVNCLLAHLKSVNCLLNTCFGLSKLLNALNAVALVFAQRRFWHWWRRLLYLVYWIQDLPR